MAGSTGSTCSHWSWRTPASTSRSCRDSANGSWSTARRRWGCRTCKVREQCTSGFTRRLTLHPREEHELLQRQRAEQETPRWKQRYGQRAGVEGTIHQAVHVTGIRTSRYRGLAKTSLAHILSAVALDLHRIDAHLTGRPLSTGRHSHFTDLDLAA